MIAIALVLSARALSVYSLVPLAVKWFHLPNISAGEKHIMWWGGLKGGLAIAVVLSIPADLPERQFLFEITLGVVLFTLLVSAPSIRPLMHYLGLSQISRGESLEFRNALHGAENRTALSRRAWCRARCYKSGRLNHCQSRWVSTVADESEHETHEDDAYFAEFRAYRVERESLQSLYKIGFISQYSYLDMSNRLHAVQESCDWARARLGLIQNPGEKACFNRLKMSCWEKFVKNIG